MKIIRIINKSFKDAFRSVFRNFSLSMASISCTVVTLIIVSIALLVTYNVNSVTKDIEDVLTIVAFIDTSATDADIEHIKDEIALISNVDTLEYNSKDAIKQDLSKNEDLKQILESLDENPVQSTVVVNVKDVKKIGDTANKIKDMEKIVSVKYGESLVNKLISMFDVIRNACFIAVIALILVTAFLISNTIKITIFSRRNELGIMRLVGTSNTVIKLPFIIEGATLGIIGSIIPILLTIYGYTFIYDYIGGNLFTELIVLVKPSVIIYKVSVVLLIVGVIVGMFGSLRAVRRVLKSMMKKIMCALSILVIALSLLMPMPQIEAATSSKAKTLAELRKELADYKAKQAKNNADKKATQNQINSAKSNVSNKQSEISQNQQKIQDATSESERLEKEIADGKKELSELVKNYQIASGDNLYLQYIFESNSYEELIYRYAVIEQIMNYQEGKITEWKDKIDYNNQLKVDLAAREIELNKQINDLADQISNLNDELEDYFDISLSVEDDIKSTEELIKYYQNLGCKENQDLQECVNVLGDTGFIRPLTKGTITSVWGNRTHPVTGKVNSFHNGIDIGGNKVGTSVYSAANGMVGKIIKKASCGGNQVYVYHTINGKRYTTSYLHLNTINVSLGQKVTSQTVIGTVGGQKGTYDTCTTGAHLHFGMGTGWYGSDYTSSSKWKANSVNPTSKISFPAKGKYFYTRV